MIKMRNFEFCEFPPFEVSRSIHHFSYNRFVISANKYSKYSYPSAGIKAEIHKEQR